MADAFQGARFLQRGAEVAGDGQRLGVVVAGLVAITAVRDASSPRQFSVSAWPARSPASRFSGEGLLVAGGSSGIVASQLLHQAKLAEGVSLAGPVAEVAELLQCFLVAGGGRPGLVAGQPLNHAEPIEGRLASPEPGVSDVSRTSTSARRGGWRQRAG